MNAPESLRDAENLRFRVQMNNRLRLECLAAVSKVFREFGEPIKDELLSSIVFALPQELISSNGHDRAPVDAMAGAHSGESYQAVKQGNPPDRPEEPEEDEEEEEPEREKPGLPPQSPHRPGLPPQGPEREKPGLPPQGPEREKPGLPPQGPEREKPGLPPQSPERDAPALPPQQPDQSATVYTS